MNSKHDKVEALNEVPGVRLRLVKDISDWLKRTFPTSAGGRKIFRLSNPLELPTSDQCSVVVALSLFESDESGISSAYQLLFARGESARSDLCSYKLTIYPNSRNQITAIDEGFVEAVSGGATRVKNANHRATDDPLENWKFETELERIELLLKPVFIVPADEIKLPHPLLPPPRGEIRIR